MGPAEWWHLTGSRPKRKRCAPAGTSRVLEEVRGNIRGFQHNGTMAQIVVGVIAITDRWPSQLPRARFMFRAVAFLCLCLAVGVSLALRPNGFAQAQTLVF